MIYFSMFGACKTSAMDFVTAMLTGLSVHFWLRPTNARKILKSWHMFSDTHTVYLWVLKFCFWSRMCLIFNLEKNNIQYRHLFYEGSIAHTERIRIRIVQDMQSEIKQRAQTQISDTASHVCQQTEGCTLLSDPPWHAPFAFTATEISTPVQSQFLGILKHKENQMMT
jgi:hypothetical protein